MSNKIQEARQSAAIKLQKAFQRAQEQSARERKAGEDFMNKNKEKPVKEGYRDYNNNRTGFARRPREDDEYHVPDDMRQKHTIRMKLSKDGGPIQHKQMDVKTLHGAEHAKNFAHDQARKQGWTVHEEVEQIDEVGDTSKGQKLLQMVNKRAVNRLVSKRADTDPAYAKKAQQTHLAADARLKEETGAYEKSEENKRSADAAKKQGDMFAHHLHMADYHDNLAQWHAEKGRHGESDRHAAKSEEHHEQAMKLKESTDACPVCGQTPCNCTSIEEAWTQGNRNPQRGIKVGHKVRSYDFPGMHDDHYIEGHVVGETPHSYHIRVNRVVRGGKEIPTPSHMTHVEAPKGKGMFNQAYAVHKMIAKQDSVAAAAEPAKGAAKTFSNIRGTKK